MAAVDSGLRLLYGDDVMDAVNKTQVLVVGAGGIGCEVLKTLVNTGFLSIEVIDLDTIDISNLNRQFLFRKDHVGQSKALIAAEAVKQFNPKASVTPHHGNIKDKKFGPEYFRKFELVINALDNVPARQHVNRMCMTVGIPLIDSGTEGYEGRVEQFRKGASSCYDCTPKATRKTYPICTIRSTPDKPVHCIVWAKELHKLVVGPPKQSMLYEAESEPAEGGAAAKSGGGSEAAYMQVIAQRPTSSDNESLEAYAKSVFHAMFHAEIEKKLSMRLEAYKVAGRVPTPLSFEAAVQAASAGSATDASADSGAGNSAAAAQLPDQRVLSVSESAQLFIHAIKQYFTTPSLLQRLGSLEFDKDTPADLNLVTAASNLRAHIFGIPLQSRWSVKSIAGNIIPAIATTNAIVAALQVSEALKRVTCKVHASPAAAFSPRCMHVVPTPDSSGALVTSLQPDTANKNCIVCSTPTLTLAVDVEHTTVAAFFKNILRGHFSMVEPFVDNGEEFAETDVKEDDESQAEFEARRARQAGTSMASAPGGGLGDSALLTINDFAQDLEFNLVVQHVPGGFDEEQVPQLFKVLQPGQVLNPKWLAKNTKSEKQETAASAMSGNKRLREEDGDASNAKAARQA